VSFLAWPNGGNGYKDKHLCMAGKVTSGFYGITSDGGQTRPGKGSAHP